MAMIPETTIIQASEPQELAALAPDAAYTVLGSRPAGLSQAAAAERLRRYGPNAIRELAGRPLALKLLANFTHLMALLLWAGGLIGFIAQLPELGIAIWAVNLINGAFSFWQEYKAEQATAALKRLMPTFARTLRDGEACRIPAEELVPGDVILLSEGDRISADARLVEAAELRVDQSTLTGESHPVAKAAEPSTAAGLGRAERPCLVFGGTNVVAGAGKAIVYATGMETAFGTIARLTQSVGDEQSPLQRELAKATRTVTIIALAVGAFFFALATVMAGLNLAEAFIFAMGMIVAFVPEGMLPTVTLALALGVQRMAKRNALVKRLSAVETLGCTSVICTDKTGTLTQNEMTVCAIWLGGRQLAVEGAGYTPDGRFCEGDRTIDAPHDLELRRLLLASALCNDARLLPPDDENPRWSVLGDPTEAALIVAARKAGIDLAAEERCSPRLREIPFESRRKRMSTIHQKTESGAATQSNRQTEPAGMVTYVKGAPRELLALCTRIRHDGREQPLDESDRTAVLAANDNFARTGLRVLGVAERPFDEREIIADGAELVERDLTFLGLIAMQDPPRTEVLDAVQRCRRAGIRVVMITGDYGLTAESIARRIGIVQGEVRLVNGADLDEMDEHALQAVLRSEVIFSRVAPEHKLRVVAALQATGAIVAVTGDGVNDAPALKKADIGVAMGITGTDVAKEAADMILTDDNFASIVSAVEEGRAVYANIKKFISYIFTSNTPEAIPFVLFALSRGQIPLGLTVMQILAVDLGTDMVPALALGAEPPESDVMDRPPRDRNEHVITRPLLMRAYLWLGLFQSIAAMAAFYFQFWSNGFWGQWIDLPGDGDLYRSATAMTLAAVVATQIGNLFAHRTERASIFRVRPGRNRLLWVGIATEIVIILLIVYAPPFQWVFKTAPFAPQNWLLLLALTPTLLLADELRKLVARRLAARQTRIAGAPA